MSRTTRSSSCVARHEGGNAARASRINSLWVRPEARRVASRARHPSASAPQRHRAGHSRRPLPGYRRDHALPASPRSGTAMPANGRAAVAPDDAADEKDNRTAPGQPPRPEPPACWPRAHHGLAAQPQRRFQMGRQSSCHLASSSTSRSMRGGGRRRPSRRMRRRYSNSMARVCTPASARARRSSTRKGESCPAPAPCASSRHPVRHSPCTWSGPSASGPSTHPAPCSSAWLSSSTSRLSMLLILSVDTVLPILCTK